jgi:hypothetical protein
MKKVNFKQPKYILPLVIFLPLAFLGYTITNFFGEEDDSKKGVVTDNINMTLPDAKNGEMTDKMTEMTKRFSEDGAYTAIGALGNEKEELDSTQAGYKEHELNSIDAENAKREAKQKELEDLERSLAESRKHINAYAYEGNSSGGGRGGRGGYGGRGSSRQDELDDYARDLEYIQQRSKERQKVLEQAFGGGSSAGGMATGDGSGSGGDGSGGGAGNRKAVEKPKPELVQKVSEQNADKFNTIGEQAQVDEPLIKAMIDKTTKAHEGTRLRFKLLDDVVIKDVKLKKGTYLYGIVTGFGQQRVRAAITSILVKDKFIKVALSVYDNDGMEGFYVPESAFRDMMKDAGAQAMQSNISLNGNSGSQISGEALALQALQNMYQSASSAISGNIRKNRAKIKYNTIVYLINTDAQSSR